MCAEGMDEVVGMFIVMIFDSKVINSEGELNGSCDVFPEAGSVRNLEVSKRSKALLEELVC